MKNIPISQRVVNILMIILVLLIIFLLVYSNQFVRRYIEKEQLAEKNRYEYESMAYSMSDTFRFTTEQARKFTITEDLSCIELYWNEVNVEKHIDKVVDKLDALDLTVQEKHLLNLAKAYTKLLMEPDIRAMKLMAQALNCESIMPERVKNYKLNIVEEALCDEEKKKVAREILFSVYYTADQYTINNAIKDFQMQMNTRLMAELNEARTQTQMAIVYQVILFSFSILLLFILVFIFYKYYLWPVSQYISELKKLEGKELLQMKPTGSKEMRVLAVKWNEMHEQMLVASQAKSNFVATVSHEIRTPLNTMIGYLYMFKETPLHPKQELYMTRIELASKHLLNMVNNILDFSKIEEEKMAFEWISFSIRACLKEIEQIFQQQVQTKALTYQVAISPEVPDTLKGDLSKLKQILMNVVSNAIKFTASGGITISVTSYIRRDQKIMVTFKITDTGIGIPKDKQQMIFKEYHQGEPRIAREYGGSGLGLAICKRIVMQWPGKILVESVEHKGTTFYIKLPFEVMEEIKKLPCGGTSTRMTLTEEVNEETLTRTRQVGMEGFLAEWMRLLEACDYRAVQFYEAHEADIASVLSEGQRKQMKEWMETYQMASACKLVKEVAGDAL